jgi:hypothetical protein
MLESVRKFTRALKRDYLPATYPDSKTFTFAKQLGMMLGITWGLCLTLLAIFPVACAWTPILGVGASVVVFCDRIREIRKDMRSRVAGQLAAENGETIEVSGPGMQVSMIENTQKLISKITAGCEQADELPPRIQGKIRAYLGDSEEAAAKITAYVDNTPQERIPFLRRAFNPAGQETAVVAASVLTPFGLERKKAADYDAAVAATVDHCQNGLTQPIKVKPLRLKRGFLACWTR